MRVVACILDSWKMRNLLALDGSEEVRTVVLEVLASLLVSAASEDSVVGMMRALQPFLAAPRLSPSMLHPLISQQRTVPTPALA